jgi:O-antigen/teichoic acid export membrane protein
MVLEVARNGLDSQTIKGIGASSLIREMVSRNGRLTVFQQTARLLSVFRLRPFETATEGGRSKERLRRVALTTLAAGVAKTIGLLASLISVPLTYRYLGPERFGIWMVLISIISAMSFADLGIGNGLMNAISEAYGREDRHLATEHVTSALALMLCIAAFLAVTGAVGYPFLPWVRLFNVKSAAAAAEGARAFLVLYVSFIINIPLGVITRAQAGLQKGYTSQIVGACGSILSLGATVLVILLHAGLAWLVFASVFASIIATLFNGWILFRECPWLLPSWHAYRARSAHKIFKLGMLFFVLQCAVAVGFTSDNIVIAQILGAAAVAAYAVPQKLFGFVSMVVSMGINPLWPAYGEAIARGDVAWVRRVFLGSLWLVLGITVPICTLLALAGPWILRVAVGKSLVAPIALLVVLAAWAVVNAVSMVISMLLNGAGVLKPQTMVAVIASMSNLALSIFLTRRMGVMGVCVGSIVTQLLIVFPAYSILIPRLFARIARAKNEIGPQGIRSLA